MDVIQGTFEYFLKKFPGFKLTASMTTFLYPVVKHLALAAKKARERHAAGEGTLAAAPARECAAATRGDLDAAVAALSEEMKETLLMRYVDDMTLEEIAAALKVPVGTVKSRLHRAIVALREDPRARAYFLG
jgi:RNA polymerase sigma-70 factor (ECF subfamily)